MDIFEPDAQRTTYATPDTVAMTLGLSDPKDPNSAFKFSDASNPTYEFVEDLILSAEDEIDLRTHRSWRENRVVDEITTINSYQWDENAYRGAYFMNGGYEIPLRKNLRAWDPTKGDRL